jgi:hypothetical protein
VGAVVAAGAVFEASLPPDLATMYRQLAVLLPQAPVPLVTVLQLWGITEPQEAQETVQIFVMQVGWLWQGCEGQLMAFRCCRRHCVAWLRSRLAGCLTLQPSAPVKLT